MLFCEIRLHGVQNTLQQKALCVDYATEYHPPSRAEQISRKEKFINKNVSYLFSNPPQGTGKSKSLMYQPASPLLPNENGLQSSTTQGQQHSPVAQSWEKELSSLHLYWNVTGYWLDELGVLRREKITKDFNLGDQYGDVIHVMSSWRFGGFLVVEFFHHDSQFTCS